MKLSTSLLLIGFLHVSAAASSQKVTVTVRNAPLTEIFKAIQRQSGYIVFYNNELMQRTVPVTYSGRAVPVREVLEQVLEPQGLKFAIEDKTIFLLAMPRVYPVAPVEAQFLTVAGRVTDRGGNALAGVSVKSKARTAVRRPMKTASSR